MTDKKHRKASQSSSPGEAAAEESRATPRRRGRHRAQGERATPAAAQDAPPRFTPPDPDSTRPAWAAQAPALGDRRLWWMAAAATLLALALRLISLTRRDLWFDEIHTWNDAWWRMQEGGPHWLFFWIVGAFSETFGRTELGLRLYPALTGALGAGLLTLWAARAAGWRAGALAGFLFALAPANVAFSQESRYYAPVACFAALSLWSATEALLGRDSRRWLWLIPWAASAWLARAHHPVGLVISGATAAWMALCAVASPWGRRMAARLLTGPRPCGVLRPFFFGAVVFVILGLLLYRIFPNLRIYLRALDFTRANPGVSFSWRFFSGLMTVYGSGEPFGSLMGKAGWILYEAAFVTGWVWLARRRAALAALAAIVFVGTLVLLFGFQSPTQFSPKYISFLHPVRLLVVAAGCGAALPWLAARWKRTQKADAAAGEWIYAAALAAVFALLSVPPLATHYTRSLLPVRPALRWIGETAPPDAPLVSYGHMNYGVAHYAQALGMAPARLRLLRWPSDSGALDAAEMRAAVPPEGGLYYIQGWTVDHPEALSRALAAEYQEVARFPADAGYTIYPTPRDAVIYRWKWGAATLREGRPIAWSAEAGNSVPELALRGADQPAEFYTLGELDAVWRVESPAPAGQPDAADAPASPPLRLFVDNRELPLRRDPGASDSVTFVTDAQALSSGPHTWRWSRAAAGAPAPRRVGLDPARPLRLRLAATQISSHGRAGKLETPETFEGRENVLFFRKNTWVEYRLELSPGAIFTATADLWEPSGAPAVLEVDLDGRFAGFLALDGKSGQWVRRAFAFRSRSGAQATILRFRLISETGKADGSTAPGVGAALASLEIREAEGGPARAALPSDFANFSGAVQFIGPTDLLYENPNRPGTIMAEWLSAPEKFEASLLDPAPAADEDRAAAAAIVRPGLGLRILPPYSGSVVSPPFPVLPDRWVYLRVPVETEEVYRIGATLFLVFANERGQAVAQVFPSEGQLHGSIDWDFVYESVEGRPRREFTFFTPAPAGARMAALGLMAWPHPVPERRPAMRVILHPPAEIRHARPDLLAR